MSKKIITVGLEYIKLGAIAGDGGMGESLTAIGLTSENSASFVSDDPQETEFFSEENDAPELVMTRPGKITFSFSIMDANADNLLKIFGGEKVVGTGSAGDTWKAPSTEINIEQSLEVKSKTGLTIKIPRAGIRGKFNSQLSRQGVFLVDVVATVLAPSKVAEPPFTLVEPNVS